VILAGCAQTARLRVIPRSISVAEQRRSAEWTAQPNAAVQSASAIDCKCGKLFTAVVALPDAGGNFGRGARPTAFRLHRMVSEGDPRAAGTAVGRHLHAVSSGRQDTQRPGTVR